MARSRARSNPSFDPNVFAKSLRQSVYKRLQDPDNGAPLANRATQGLYPTGSTFKLISSTAMLESGLITPATTLFDGGSLTVGGVTFKNAGTRPTGRSRWCGRFRCPRTSSFIGSG